MTIDQIITSFDKWLTEAVDASVGYTKRTWCMLDFNKELTHEAIREHFDRSELNDEYVNRYGQTDIPSKQPYAYVQAEIDMIYSAHKSFVSRHKTRLQHYRDDCAQKDYFTRTSVAFGYAKFKAEKSQAEKGG